MNKKEQIKKKREKNDVLSILSYLNIDESQCDWSMEKPDCRYTTPDGDVIGVEVVRTSHSGEASRQMSKLFSAAAHKCLDSLNKEDWKDKSFFISFNSNRLWEMPKLKTHEFYKIVIDEFARHLKYDDYLDSGAFLQDIKQYKELDRQGAFDYNYIEDVKVKNTPGLCTVNHFVTYFVPSITPEAVEHSIEEKNKKLNDYQALPQNADIKEYWLFIAVDRNSHNDLDDLPPINVPNEYARIYICDDRHAERIK